MSVSLKNKGLIYYASSLLVPSIMLFYLYNHNHVENHIVFSNVMTFAGIMAFTGVALLWVLRWVVGHVEGAFVLSILFWLCFWLFGAMYGLAAHNMVFLPPAGLMAILGAALILLAMLFRRYASFFAEARTVLNIVAFCLAVLFFFNMTPSVNRGINLHRARAAMISAGGTEELFKRNFQVTSRLPSPDIYWFHMDGMMSLETVERFWGYSHEYLREELFQRGFLVYENAFLNAGFTDAALIALLSPKFYDSYFNELVSGTERKFRSPRQTEMVNRMAQDGLVFRDIHQYSELFNAFIAAGYTFVPCSQAQNQIISEAYFMSLIGYRYITNRWSFLLVGDLPMLLTLTTPLNISAVLTSEPVDIYQSDSSLSPYFFWKEFWYTHTSQAQIVNPDLPLSRLDIQYYPMAFQYGVDRMLDEIDRVLERNPNAVIVLQSDHGLHRSATQQHLIDIGLPKETILELAHSVFSAVRIPEFYGGIDAPIHPLNITRLLVNRFVGQNYELLKRD